MRRYTLYATSMIHCNFDISATMTKKFLSIHTHIMFNDPSHSTMTTAAAGIYAKGSHLGNDKEWYHGELSRAEAEQVLTTSGCDCFLVRVSEGALILSLIHHGQLHHINIKYGRGWYELETGEAPYTLTELEELVSHYCDNEIKGLRIKLGAACTKATIDDLPHLYESIDAQIYVKGVPEDLIKHSWYHGNISREQADAALSKSSDNGFLVRVSDRHLVLSKKLGGWVSHDVIHYSPKGYKLDGKEEHYESVSELITHYQHHPIEGPRVLGTAIATVPSVQELEEALAYEPILFTKEDTTLNIQWKKFSELPVAISVPQVVKIRESVYVGGGMRQASSHEAGLTYKFNETQETWMSLPPCPTSRHALTTLNSELIAIGGKVHNEAVSTVYTFKRGEWIKVLPEMITPRYLLAALSYDNRFLIAAGGQTGRRATGEVEDTNAVEIYSSAHNTWFSTFPLPSPRVAFSMCIIHETCYILGSSRRADDNSFVLYSQISDLLKNVRAPQQHMLQWKQLKDRHPLFHSTFMELNQKIIALGGSSDVRHRSGTKFVSVYDFASDMWIKCKGAELPVPLYKAGVVKLDSDQVMIVGGQTKMQQFLATVYIGKIAQN